VSEKMQNNLNFEEAIARLEDIVKKLEAGNISLDESLLQFEEAVSLVRLCNEKLESAEQKVRILTEKNGVIVDLPFDKDIDAT